MTTTAHTHRVFNYVFTQTLLATHPEISVIK
jgi:hypothetical protein